MSKSAVLDAFHKNLCDVTNFFSKWGDGIDMNVSAMRVYLRLQPVLTMCVGSSARTRINIAFEEY